ncbi:hypothetical protein [Jatrophihabitans sp.]|uniref:hypothetical protein n=1 Tax=Jatrophihabitans sp. TaxID=1932789 RepID=UPI0030C77DA6|nr:hypothetical protein [Jatrophihabitans sp.]
MSPRPAPGSVLMWEVRAAEGRLDELVEAVRQRADPAAQLFRSAEPDERVVVIDPTHRGVPDLPPELVARPPHEWVFDTVGRDESPV